MKESRSFIPACLVVALIASGIHAAPVDKSGTKPSILSLPSGPGSIEGLGKAFQPQINTGTASYAVALKLPPGTAGFAPSVELSYNSGAGNSPFGQGWNCSPFLSIERQTEKGFPRYRDRENGSLPRDVFLFQGEELVPLSNGTYRCENETGFRRFAPFKSTGGAVDSWLVEDRNGVKHWLGRYLTNSPSNGSSRVAHPAPPLDGLGARSPFEQTYLWCEDAAEDLSGNRIEYNYRADFTSPGILYLQTVRYFAKGNASNYHEVAWHYESRSDELSDNRGGFTRVTGLRCREITVASFYDGARHPVRSYAISYRTADGAMGDIDQQAPANQKQLNLGLSYLCSITEYDSRRTQASPDLSGNVLPPMRFAYAGFSLNPPVTESRAALAALRFRLRPGEVNPIPTGPKHGTLFQAANPDAGGPFSPRFDLRLENSHVQFVDMNGDGLPDLLNSETDQNHPLYEVAWNMGQGVFRTSIPVTTSPALINLADSSLGNTVTLTDVDGDGISDLIQIVDAGGPKTRLYPNRYSPARADGPTGFISSPITDAMTPLDVSLSAPNVRQMDVDFDKRPDVLVSSETGITAYRSERNGGWSNLGRQDWDNANAGGIPISYRFSRVDMDASHAERANPMVQLADMNGDRLLDLILISVPEDGKAVVAYRPLIGPMRWGEEVTFSFALADGSSAGDGAELSVPGLLSDPMNPQNGWNSLQLLDVNGDGLTDLVSVQQNQTVLVYFNCHGVAFRGPFTINNTPTYQPYDPSNPTILRTLDINGNGSIDLVFYHASGDDSLVGFRYVDFISGQKPGLLQVIDNGIGRKTFIRYRPATEDLIRSRKSGHPWLTTMPNPVWVVSGTVDDIGLDLNGDGETDKYATSFDYRDGYYDGFEKQFRGFAYAQKISWGDDVTTNGLPSAIGLGQVSAPTGVTRYRFMTGSPDGADNDEYIADFDTEPRPASLTVDETTELGGREEESLKGKPVWEEAVDAAALTDITADFDRCAGATAVAARSGDPYGADAARATPDRYVYSRTHSRWALRRLYRPDGTVAPKGRLLPDESGKTALVGKSVTFPILTQVTTEVIEANELLRSQFSITNAPFAAQTPVITRKSMDYDNFGNMSLENNEGIVSGLSPLPDDERVTRRQFILAREVDGSIPKWIVDRVQTERVEDENGVFVNESRHYYDGLDFLGLPLGQIGVRGLETRVQRRVKDPASPIAAFEQLPTAAGGVSALQVPGDPRSAAREWIDDVRKAYDEYGNTVFVMDALGVAAAGIADTNSGHVRQLSYDPTFHTFPIEERISVGEGKADLVMRAEYQRSETAARPEVPWGFGVMTRSVDFNGNPTDYFYDSFARLTAIVKPGDSELLPTLLFSYRPADPHRGLRYNYDRAGILSQEATASPTAANAVQTDAREKAGEAGVFTTLSYTDGNGNKLLTLSEDETAEQFNVKGATRFNLRGSALATFQPYQQTGSGFALPPLTNARTDFFSDGIGRVIRTLLPPETDSRPDDRRETRTHFLPFTEYAFDEEDIASTDPTQSHVNTPMVHHKDGLGRLIGVDEMVRLKDDGTASESLVSWPTRYSYDLNDNLVHIRDSQANEKWFRYDGLGRKLFMNDPDRGTMTYTYDEASNLRSTTDAKAQTISYDYDGVNRLLAEYYRPTNQPPDVTYHYDAPYQNVPVGDGTAATASNTKGMLVWVQDLSGEEHTSYDSRSRIEWVIKRIPDPQFLSAAKPTVQLVSYRTGFAYDSIDRVTTLTYPDNDQIGYDYNARNLLRQIVGGVNGLTQNGLVISNIVYQPSDQLAQIHYGNGVRTTYGYDPRLRLNSLLTVSQAPTPNTHLINFSYDFDGVSNIRSITDKRPPSAVPLGDPRRNTQVFSYDNLYRITRATYNPATLTDRLATNYISYRYDRIGNMLAQNSDIQHSEKGLGVTDLGDMSYGAVSGKSTRIGRAADDAPGPHALTGVYNGNRAYPYDANGNMTLIDGMTNSWDFKDRLIAVENQEMRAEYTYDYTDRRIIKRVAWKPGYPLSSDNKGVGSGESISVLYPDRYFEVREHDAPTKYVWNGNTRVARVTGSFTPNQRVQRFRLWPGWNLVSLAVTATNAVEQLAGGAIPSRSLLGGFKWNVATTDWEAVDPKSTLAAGTVLWLKTATNSVAEVTGTYADPTNRFVPPGASFQACAGLETWPAFAMQPLDLVAWRFDGKTQTWLMPFDMTLSSRIDFPTSVAVGDGFMARAESSAMLEGQESEMRIHFNHNDHIGSPCLVTDSEGSIIVESANYAFGFMRNALTPHDGREPYQFAQKEADAESIYSYFEARFAATHLGRFIRVEPLAAEIDPGWLRDPQRLNSYAYSLNNALSIIDTTGLSPSRLGIDIDPRDTPATQILSSSADWYTSRAMEIAGTPGSPTRHIKGVALLSVGIALDFSREVTGMEQLEQGIRTTISSRATSMERVKEGAKLAWQFGSKYLLKAVASADRLARFASVREAAGKGVSPLIKQTLFWLKGDRLSQSSIFRYNLNLIKTFDDGKDAMEHARTAAESGLKALDRDSTDQNVKSTSGGKQ
jgi:RHS repeat-associated protein